MLSPPPFFDHPKDGYQMVLVPGGEALFGMPESDADAYPREQPQFCTHLPGFYLGKYPVRNRDCQDFIFGWGLLPVPEMPGIENRYSRFFYSRGNSI